MLGMDNTEIEVKFFISDLAGLEARLKHHGAELKQPRVHEMNLRFDWPDGSLTREKRVLRLRQDNGAHLTYKGPPEAGQPVSVRTEIEFEVSDFNNAQKFLKALGYVISIWYEKYRTTYLLAGVTVTLDEMPFGTFCELEGPEAESIQKVAAELSIDWEARSTLSYLALFERLKQSSAVTASNVSFAELGGQRFSAIDLGMLPADL
jgi:adenylate cyclase class 2